MLIASVILVSSLISEPLYTALALGFVVVSVPVHATMEWYKGRGGGEAKADAVSSGVEDDEDNDSIRGQVVCGPTGGSAIYNRIHTIGDDCLSPASSHNLIEGDIL